MLLADEVAAGGWIVYHWLSVAIKQEKYKQYFGWNSLSNKY